MFLGRDIELMKAWPVPTGLQVVPCTGIYTYEHLPMPLRLARCPDQIANLFVHDIEEGIQGTGHQGGVPQVRRRRAWRHRERREGPPRGGHGASLRTGVPIMAHSRPASDTAPRQIEIFAEEGVDLDKVQIAHCGDSAPTPITSRA